MAKFRVNYGSGQVSRTFDTRAEAERERVVADRHGGRSTIEFYEPGTADDPGDWFKAREVPDTPRRRRSHQIGKRVV